MAEVPQMEMRARLSADTAQFTKGMQNASASMEQFAQNSNKLRGAMVGIGAASAGFTAALIAFGTQSFMAAARIEELDYAMDAIGKSTKLGYQAIKDTANAIKSEGIEMEVASQAAIKFAQNNLDMSKASLLARAAQDFAIVGAKNSTETFNMLTHAVITGRSEVLKSVGIQKSAGQMYDDFAKTLGKSAAALTYQEKQQAVLTGALKEAENVAGAYLAAMQSPGKVLRSFPRMINNIQISMGNMLLKGIGPIVFHMYEFIKSFSKAIDESVAFQLVIEAVKQVVIKVSAPFVTFFKHLKTMLDGLTRVTKVAEGVKSNFDPVGDSVKNLATKIEFLMPAIAALLAMFATFAGAALFANVPVLGALLGTLAGPIGIIVVGLATLYITSNQVKDAFNKLFSSLSPVISLIVSVGKAFAVAAGFGVAIFAKAVSGLATVIKSTTTFLTQHRAILNGIKYVLAVLIASYVAYKAIMLGQLAVSKVSAIMTAIHAKMTNALAIANARAAVAQAQNNVTLAAHNVVTAQANVVNAAHAVALGGGTVAASALAVAELRLTGQKAALTAATAAQAGAQTALNAALAPTALILFGTILAIAALVIAFVIAWKSSEKFREVVTTVIDFVAKYIGRAIAFIMRAFGYWLKGIAYLADTNKTFGHVLATIYEFILDTILLLVIYALKYYKRMADSFLLTVKAHEDAYKLIFKIFELIARIIGAAITNVLLQYALLLKGIATVIYYFGVLRKWIGEQWTRIAEAIGRAVEGISRTFGILGGFVSGITSFMRDAFADFIDFLVRGLERVPNVLRLGIGNFVLTELKDLSKSLRGTKKDVEAFQDVKTSQSLAKNITDTADRISDGITAASNVVIQKVKDFGNYTGGIAGTLSTVANGIVNVAQAVTNFAGSIEGDKVLAGLVKGAEKTSKTLGDVISVVEKIRGEKVFEKVLKVVSTGAGAASDWLFKTAATVESFTSSKFTEKMGDFFGDLVKSLKTGLGFGDILGDLKKEFSLPGIKDDETAETDTEKQAKRLDAIRETMKSAIDSIKGVLDDLRNAARDFADSLKETIVGFAGLKSIELPDGFIPKAKSLIENMNQRLNKSLQFGNQIAQLQSLELDASALRDIIEAGPIKGAQLASSILTGDAKANISQINALQKAITYSGAAIGQLGAEAGFGGLIANAEATYASLQGDLKTTTRGTNQYIEQGAFQINISTAGAKNTDEQIEIITNKIQETFAILARELAAK